MAIIHRRRQGVYKVQDTTLAFVYTWCITWVDSWFLFSFLVLTCSPLSLPQVGVFFSVQSVLVQEWLDSCCFFVPYIYPPLPILYILVKKAALCFYNVIAIWGRCT